MENNKTSHYTSFCSYDIPTTTPVTISIEEISTVPISRYVTTDAYCLSFPQKNTAKFFFLKI